MGAGEGKKREMLGGPAEGGPAEGGSRGRGSGGGGVRGRAQILDGPTKNLNTHRTDTPHNTTGDPAQGGLGHGSLARKTNAKRKKNQIKILLKQENEKKYIRKCFAFSFSFSFFFSKKKTFILNF